MPTTLKRRPIFSRVATPVPFLRASPAPLVGAPREWSSGGTWIWTPSRRFATPRHLAGRGGLGFSHPNGAGIGGRRAVISFAPWRLPFHPLPLVSGAVSSAQGPGLRLATAQAACLVESGTVSVEAGQTLRCEAAHDDYNVWLRFRGCSEGEGDTAAAATTSGQGEPQPAAGGAVRVGTGWGSPKPFPLNGSGLGGAERLWCDPSVPEAAAHARPVVLLPELLTGHDD